MASSFSFMCLLSVLLALSQDCFGKTHHQRHSAKSGDDGKIVGGEEVDIQDYSFMAYLLLEKSDGYYQCGGSIVNRRTILTAAHCIEGVIRITARINSTIANDGGTEYMALDLRPHPLYNSTTKDYDVAIVKTIVPMDLTGLKRVRIPSSGSSVPAAGTNVTTVGWGATQEGGPVSNTLMAVTVPVVSNEECRTSYTTVTTRMLCAGVPEGGKDSCQGDSGGPALTSRSSGLQVGIVSFGIGCARPGIPGVYTRVAQRNVNRFIRANSRL